MADEIVAAAPTTTSAAASKETSAPAATKDAPSKEAVITKPANAQATTTAPAEAQTTEPIVEATPKPGDKPAVPEKYELKLSKDSPLDPAYVAKLEAEAKAKGLSNEQAQELLARDEASSSAFVQRQQEQAKQQQKAWISEVETDNEIGGKALKENVETAKRALAKFADPAFMKTLDETGLGNHPQLIRTFLRIGKMIGEDKLVTDGKADTSSKSKASRESKLYPGMTKTQE